MSRFAHNIVHFVRVLRRAGLAVGPDRTLDAIAAASAVGVARRDDFGAALAAVLVTRPEHRELFDQAFEVFWRNPRLLEKMLAQLLPRVRGRVESEALLAARVAQALTEPGRPHPVVAGEDQVDFDAAFTFSDRDTLRHRDFESMTQEELADVRTMMANLRLPLPERPTRRKRRGVRGSHIDLRAMLRRTAGAAELAPLPRRERRARRPPLIVLCDISGSMERYTRMLMHFVHAITNSGDRVQVFLFGTRLTNATRHFRHRDVDIALARAGAAADDWAGGTRIGECLREFNRRWARRTSAQNAVVLLISDGLDAAAGEGLATEMQRLSRSCRRVIWLNPLLRYEAFEPRPAGIRAILPYVDDFLPCHNVASLTQLARAFGAVRARWN
jgi:uncharacterized protein with von Willebrand factor type A (vWA) domain